MEKTFTLPEFREYLEAKNNPGEYMAAKINRAGAKMRGMAAFVLASTVDFTAYADTADAFAKLDAGGFKLLGAVQRIGFWICVIMCAIEVLRCLFQGENKDILKITVKYIIGFSSLYAIPTLFRFIVTLFV